MNPSVVSILIGIALLGYAVYNIVVLIRNRQKKSASQSWPAGSASLVEKRVIEQRSRNGRSYHPEVTYTYTVMGQEFRKEKRIGGIFSRRKAEEKLAELGNSLEIRYNPNNPADHISILDKLEGWSIFLILGAIAIGLFILYMAVF